MAFVQRLIGLISYLVDFKLTLNNIHLITANGQNEKYYLVFFMFD
jgi:hypothetical protein